MAIKVSHDQFELEGNKLTHVPTGAFSRSSKAGTTMIETKCSKRRGKYSFWKNQRTLSAQQSLLRRE
jgi:hypothetical protein